MNEWGLNPATIQAVGTIATIFALFFIIGSFWNSSKQTAVAERESNLRTRPWLNIAGVRFASEALEIKLTNFGILPAFEPQVTVVIDTSGARNGKEFLDGFDNMRMVSPLASAIFPDK